MVLGEKSFCGCSAYNNNIFKCNELELALLRIKILPPSALRQNLGKNKNLDRQINSYSNNLADFNNVNKEYLPKNSSQKILPKNPSKKSSQKISTK